MVKKADLNRTQKLIRGMEIPSRPTVLLEVMKATNAFAPDMRQVADIIKRDLVLSAQVLEEANTNLRGYQRSVASVEQAVLLLGLPRVRLLVTQQFLSASLVGKDSPMQKFRRRSVEVGRAAAKLAGLLPEASRAFHSGYLPAVDPEEAYLLGMFHDCGIAVLLQKFADYEELHDGVQTEANGSLVGAERAQYQTDHSLVGYLLCERWRLPPDLCEVIRDHHQMHGFAKAGKKVADRRKVALFAILKLAEKVTGELTDLEWQGIEAELALVLDVEPAVLLRLVASLGAAPTEEGLAETDAVAADAEAAAS